MGSGVNGLRVRWMACIIVTV